MNTKAKTLNKRTQKKPSRRRRRVVEITNTARGIAIAERFGFPAGRAMVFTVR